jgi:hypothetical protein
MAIGNEAGTTDRSEASCTPLSMRKVADTDLAEVLTDLPGVLSLTVGNNLCQILQRILFRIKPVAEYIGQFASPRGTHFYGSQEWKLFLRRKMLQRCSCIYTIMIGNSNQAKLLTYQVIDQLFGHPCAITESGMHLEINSSISR